MSLRTSGIVWLLHVLQFRRFCVKIFSRYFPNMSSRFWRDTCREVSFLFVRDVHAMTLFPSVVCGRLLLLQLRLSLAAANASGMGRRLVCCRCVCCTSRYSRFGRRGRGVRPKPSSACSHNFGVHLDLA